ncbi:hypothetical protein DPV78_003089 [Talaromyces pinophilus]|nr:hypothetical protein DPV78_003089 [Talaromyces pinophilus]
MRWTLTQALAFLQLASASSLQTRDTVTAQVNFNQNTSWPQHLASGLLYGVPDTVNQVPVQFFEDIGYNYERAGGSQLPAPGRGWIFGVTEYQNRFNSVLSNYITAREFDATFILLLSDLWGADLTQPSNAPWPGDNGDWSMWDGYLNQLISDIKSHQISTKLVIDIWNEPEASAFWNRTQTQYLQMWGRTYYKLRSAFGTTVQISGPSTANAPSQSNSWFQAWAQFVGSNQSVPDQYTWHMEGGSGDLVSSQAGLDYFRGLYGLPARLININEYATQNEQVPAGSAWFISQLERINANGCRGSWGWGETNLHNYMSGLLGETSTGTYYPNGDYQVYKYYYRNMTGYRVGTLPSSDLKLDAYATVDTNSRVARVLFGVRPSATGTWNLQMNSLSSIGLPSSGTLNIRTWGFFVASDVHFGEVDAPTYLGTAAHSYSGNTLTLPVFQNDNTTAFAFEFSF